MPHDRTVPSARRASAKAFPAATCATPLRPDTRVGTLRASVVPSASCPALFTPHAHTHPLAAPSSCTAREKSSPAAMLRTPLKPMTCTGVARGVVVPSPSWPLELSPHAHTLPSLFNAS